MAPSSSVDMRDLHAETKYLRPSDLDLAFALHVVKSVPAQHSIQTYLESLRAHVRIGRLGNQKHHFDGLDFWKTRFDSSEQENTRLRAQVTSLTKALRDTKLSDVPTISPKEVAKARHSKAPELDRLIEDTLTTTVVSDPLKHETATHEGLKRFARHFSAWMSAAMDRSDLPHTELVLRLVKTVFRRLTEREHAAVTRGRISSHSAELAVELIPLISKHSQATGDVAQAYNDLPLVLDLFLRASGEKQHAVFEMLVAEVATQLRRPQRPTARTLRSSTGSPTRVVDALVSLLCVLEHVTDEGRVFEQRIVRQLSQFGPVEQELWSLGVVRAWIRFE